MQMEIPEDMIVPDLRRDISKMSNVRWLLRNIRIKNEHHPKLDETVDMLIGLTKGN